MTDGNREMSRRAFLTAAAGSAAAAGAAGAAAAQETETPGGDETGTETEGGEGGNGGDGGGEGENGGGDGGGGGGGTEEVVVGPGGDLTFEPGTDEPLQILPGTTVEFVWDSDNHNIAVTEQPEDANWEGHEPIENSGFTYEYTFEVLGTYEYVCEPHEMSGMVGAIEVVEEISTPAPSNVPEVPDSAKTLGVATTFAMVATLGLAFFFLKYGGDYELDEE